MRTKIRAGMRTNTMIVISCNIMRSNATLSYQLAVVADLGSEVEGDSNRH